MILCTFVILYKRMKSNYGADDRPMLHDYRRETVDEKTLKEWEKKGVEIK